MTDLSTLQARIANLSDDQAVRALTLVAEHEYREDVLSAKTQWSATEPRIREAVTEAELAEYLPSPHTVVNDGELARATLMYAADPSAGMTGSVDQAIAYAASPSERFDPATLAVGGLALVMLQTEVKLERQPNGQWKFLIHKKPMRDSTLGHVLTTLIGRFMGGPK